MGGYPCCCGPSASCPVAGADSADVEYPSSGWENPSCVYSGQTVNHSSFSYGGGTTCFSDAPAPSTTQYATLAVTQAASSWSVGVSLKTSIGIPFQNWGTSGSGSVPLDTPIMLPHISYSCGFGCPACAMTGTPQDVIVTLNSI